MRPRPFLFAFASLLCSSSAWAGCAFTTTTDELVTQLDLAEASYAELDVEAFATAVDEAAMSLPCLADTLDPALAGRVHRIQALRLFGMGDETHPRQALVAARRIDPDTGLSEVLIPAGHPLHEMFDAAGSVELATAPVSVPLEGSLLVDGAPREDRPLGQALIVQLLDAEGAPVQTRYLFSGDQWLDYPGHPIPEPLPLDAPPGAAKGVLLGVGGAALLGGLGALGGGAALAAGWGKKTEELEIDRERAEQIVRTNHTLVLVGSGLTAVGLGVGAVGLMGTF